MTDHILAFLAYAVLFVFLVILGWWVQRIDLACVIAITLILAGIDAWQVTRSHDARNHASGAAPDHDDGA